MARRATTVRQLCVEAGLGLDEGLIALWGVGLEYLVAPSAVVDPADVAAARTALGLASPTQLQTIHYWAQRAGLAPDELVQRLLATGINKPFSGRKLSKQAQRRLRSLLADLRPSAGETVNLLAASSIPPRAATELIPWEAIGHERTCTALTIADVERIHEELALDFAASGDPISPPGVKSQALLESAVNRPVTANGNVRKYPTIEMAAAALLHALVHNHPFHNGNKRTALVAMLVFLDRNGIALTCDHDELFKLVLRLAQHSLAAADRRELPDQEVLHLAIWLRRHSRVIEKGDRAMPWLQLRRRLSLFDCRFVPASRGHRMSVERDVVRTKRSLFGKLKTETLSFQFTNVQDGREIDRNTISRMRVALELDDSRSVDSAAFYDDAALSTSDFIRRYQSILKRLARL